MTIGFLVAADGGVVERLVVHTDVRSYDARPARIFPVVQSNAVVEQAEKVQPLGHLQVLPCFLCHGLLNGIVFNAPAVVAGIGHVVSTTPAPGNSSAPEVMF